MARLDRDDLDFYLRTRWAPACGRRLKKRRVDLGLTQAQLFEASGVPIATISQVELGKIYPKDDLRIVLSHALGCELESIWQPPTADRILAAAEDLSIEIAA